MSDRETLLVTGGTGFIGSHIVRLASDAGRDVVVLDDLSSGPPAPLPKNVPLIVGDIGERELVTQLLRERHVSAVVHCAGRYLVGESIRDPALYFDVNVARTLQLLLAIRDAGVTSCVFSSAAAVYGHPSRVPIPEGARCEPTNAFGATKLCVEHALDSWAIAYGLRWAALRYFNASGAHPDGTLREDHEPETHLIPLALDAGLGIAPPLRVFGDTYDTPDGTCIRDFVHVQDVATAHLAAVAQLEAGRTLRALNIGSGRGHSVHEVIDAGSKALRRPIPYSIAPRRPGDSPIVISDSTAAMSALDWHPARSDLQTIIEDALRARRPAAAARSRTA